MLARFNLRSVVRDAIESTKSRRDAKDRLIKQANKDLALREALIEAGATHSVGNYYCTERQVAFKAESTLDAAQRKLKDFTPDVIRRRAERTNRRLFWHRYTLFGSGNLAEAKRPDLLESVAMRKQLAQGNLQNAAFEQSIARRMKDDNKPVSRCFTAGEIEKIARNHNLENQEE